MSDESPYGSTSHDEDRHSPYSSAYYAQKTSALAILSVVSGLISFPMMCLCFVSIPFSVFAIVSGHMSRGIVRDTNGEYTGMEMATFGMILGYCSFILVSGFLAVSMIASEQSSTKVTTVQRNGNEGSVLLRQAKSQLQSGTEEATFGVSSTEHSADDLARHYVETLHVLDETHFAETNSSASVIKRPYRAFVQLNATSVAILLQVPDYDRFTESALEILHERCWLIAQRTMDETLPENADLAVAIYSDNGLEVAMIGVTQRTGPAKSGLRKTTSSEKSLAKFFVLATTSSPKNSDAKPATDSKIDAKGTGELVLPAEAG